MNITNRISKFFQNFPGAMVVFIVTTIVLMPAICNVLNYDLAWLHHIDETEYHKFLFDKVQKWGILSPLTLGTAWNYSWIHWLILGIPMCLLFIPLGLENAAVFWPRFVAVIAFAASLSVIWIIARKAGIPIWIRLGILLLIGFMPSFVDPVTSFRPDSLMLLGLVSSFYFLMEDEGRLGGNWYKSVFTWGIAVGLRVVALFTGPGLAVYWLYFSWQRHQIRWQSFRLILKSFLLAATGFIVTNLVLLHPKALNLYIEFANKMNISNQTNHGRPMEGLDFWTWFPTCSTYFIWLPWLILITLMGLIAVRHEWREKSTRPYALIGLVSFWSAFVAVALLTHKDSSWSHYLIAAFAGFPLLLLGIIRLLDFSLNRRYRWLYLLILVVFTSTQLNLTTSLWWEKVALEYTPKYEIAKGNLEKIRAYVATLPNPSEIKILDREKTPTPNKIKQVSAFGPSLEENFLNKKFLKTNSHPDLIILNESFDWNLPLNVEIPESSSKQELEKSRLLFHQAQSEGVKLGGKLYQFRKVPLDLKELVLFRVLEVK